MSVLLLTGTISPFVIVDNNDPEKRLQEYMTTLKKYIKSKIFDSIVFVENSGTKKSLDELYNLAKDNNVQFEWIDVSSTADRTNMSTGEASMIRDALSQSSLLQNEDYIWKCNGRIYVSNFDKLINTTDNCFLYSNKYHSIQTWIYRIDKSILQKLVSEEAIQLMKDQPIEYVWMSLYKPSFKFKRFIRYPRADGYHSQGTPYSNTFFVLLLKDIALKMGYFDVKK